ncbi:protein YciX [Escherichia coli]
MVSQEQLESSPLCKDSDNEPETKRKYSIIIPTTRQLTSQQQAFIELFAEDDQPKQSFS